MISTLENIDQSKALERQKNEEQPTTEQPQKPFSREDWLKKLFAPESQDIRLQRAPRYEKLSQYQPFVNGMGQTIGIHDPEKGRYYYFNEGEELIKTEDGQLRIKLKDNNEMPIDWWIRMKNDHLKGIRYLK